ncbi:baseplate J/gp47 family protein [Myxococcus sp. K15C18031901]|uniref:baseplate J/gp47 family protein n=1 Tax=Myxococcus dinghuensis TaxID=2906761 RepID=UPI0020A736B4|nr:baseplate J/gp47 family protein [Myxococcus dinghuensis]MCP3099521.1 baseplate J/gp47 family protein [Myxococcus dinghuensis]
MSLIPPEKTTFSAIVERLLENMGAGTDPNVGGMARTLAEAYAREMATFYAMMELAHRAGYLDTAEGAALDNVVAVLGIKRARAGRLAGDVELSRAAPAPDDIGIPAGRLVTGIASDGKPLPLFETLEDATLRKGETRVVIPIQEVRDDSEAARSAPAVINPFQLTIMPRPILGIEAISNPAPLRRVGEEETDENLRARARTALRDGEKGTLEAIAAAVRQQGVQQVTVREPEDAPPGVVDILVGDADFELDVDGITRVEKAIRESKAAGIRARLSYARNIYFQVDFQVEPIREDMDEATFDRLRRQLQEALSVHLNGLPVGTTVSRRKLEAVLYGNPGVRRITGLQVATFIWGKNAAPPPDKVLVQEEESREYGLDRDWRLGSLDAARIDLEKKPPRITRLRPPIWRLDLVVALVNGEARTPEQVRESLRSAVSLYGARLAEDAEIGQPAELTWDPFEQHLMTHARISALVNCDVRLETGITVTLVDATPAPLSAETVTRLVAKPDLQLQFGGAELVGGG